MKLNKKVTILMAAYNAEKFIFESITSLLNQSYGDFDLLIVNDGSTDKTEDIITSFSDHRIKYLKNDNNLGVGKSISIGMNYIDSKYIMRFDSDDVALSTWVESLVCFMEENPKIALASCLYDIIGDVAIGNKRIETPLQIRTRALFHCPIPQYIIIRSEFLKNNNISYDPNLRVAIDYDLYLKVLRRGEIAKVPEVLVKYIRHQNSLTSKFYSLQDEISTKLKLKLLYEISGFQLDKSERKIFMCYIFYRVIEDAKLLNDLKIILAKIRKAYFNQSKYPIDKGYYIKVEYEILRIFLIQNKVLGFPLLFYYLKNFLLDFRIFLFSGLILRVIQRKFF